MGPEKKIHPENRTSLLSIAYLCTLLLSYLIGRKAFDFLLDLIESDTDHLDALVRLEYDVDHIANNYALLRSEPLISFEDLPDAIKEEHDRVLSELDRYSPQKKLEMLDHWGSRLSKFNDKGIKLTTNDTILFFSFSNILFPEIERKKAEVFMELYQQNLNKPKRAQHYATLAAISLSSHLICNLFGTITFRSDCERLIHYLEAANKPHLAQQIDEMLIANS